VTDTDAQVTTTALDTAPTVDERQRRSTRHARVWATRLGMLGTVIVAWELLSGPVVAPILVSSPGRIARQFGEWVLDGTLVFHAYVSIRSAALGFVIGAVAAVSVGYLVGVSRFWADVLEPFISAAWAMPRIALVPVLIIWVGIGSSLSVAIAAILVFFLLFYNTYYGIREVAQSLIDSVRIMGGGAVDVAMRVRIPSALVWIVAGAKVSIPQAFVGVVTAEILASNRGLGYLIARRAGQFDTTGAFAVLLTLLLVGFSLDRVVTFVSQRALIWKGDGAG
jgi:NitT/TauT family transport system permease protein